MVVSRKKILAISGSIRKQSSNESILNHIAGEYKDLFDIEVFNQLDELPYFNPDLDNDDVPAAVINFREKISSADGVIICTPEYVFSLPGVLKNAIEWTVSTTIFSEKPVAILIASAHGEKAMESLTLIMKTIYSKIGDGSTLLIKGVKGKVKNGKIIDNGVKANISELMSSFIRSID